MTKHSLAYRARPRQPRPATIQGSADYNLEAFREVLGLSVNGRIAPTERTLFGLPAAWAALNKMANPVAMMMTDAQVMAADRRTPIEPTPGIVEYPSADLDPFTYWKMVATSAICRGNFIGINCDFDALGYPRQVFPVPFDSVNAFYDPDGFVVYEIAGEYYRPDEITHVRMGITLPGQIMTIGVVEAHRRGIGGMLDQQGMAGSVWRDGAVPTGIVQLDTNFPTKAQTDTVKEGWVSILDGKRTVAVTGKAMTYTPIQWSADDAQFLESRQFSVAEMALMIGFRPEDLGSSFGSASGSTSYGNRTDDALQRIVDAYAPCLLPIEQAWSRLTPGRQKVRGDAEALLRMTTEQRYGLHKIAQEIGLETQDETRAMEGKPKAPPAPTPDPTDPPDLTDPTNSNGEPQ